MKAEEFIKRLKSAVEKKTLYVMGCFGAPMTPANKARWISAYSYNTQAARRAKIEAATTDTFGFDCVCFVKGILWGWTGDIKATYGGAKYCSNGVPDIGTEEMIQVCKERSRDFTKLTAGELLWLPGHVGVVVDPERGIAVEASPKWKDGCQYSAINRDLPGYNRRDWAEHGKLPWVEYKARNTMVEVFQRWLNSTYGFGISEDGDCGPETKAAAVKGMQKQLNNLGEELEVDGKCGPLTMAAMSRHMVKKGQRGNRVYIIQGLLYGAEYNPAGFDGSFGAATDSSVKAFQEAHGLETDGKVGGLTLKEMTK